jgi:hypothetical protein
MILISWENIDVYLDKKDQNIKIILIPRSGFHGIEISIDFYWIFEIIYLSNRQIENLYNLLVKTTQDINNDQNRAKSVHGNQSILDFKYEEDVAQKYRNLIYRQIRVINKTELLVTSVLKPMKFDYNFAFLNFIRDNYYQLYLDANLSFSDYLVSYSNLFGLNRLEELIINSRWDVREQAMKSVNFREFINEWYTKFGIYENSIFYLLNLFYRNEEIKATISPKTIVLANYKPQNGMSRVNEFVYEYLNSKKEEFQTINFGNFSSDRVDVNLHDRIFITLSPLDIEFFYKNMPWLFQSRVKIWYLIWELKVLPSRTHNILEDIDLILVPSRFVYQSIPKSLQGKTRILPLRVNNYIESPRKGLRHKLQQNEKYLLISFDYDSDFDRKNPELALEAYIKSEIYEKYEVKIRVVARNNSSKLKNLNKYRSHKGIEFVENHLSNEEYHEILLNAIALISTHRSEGYGLNLSEAMILGTLVIATKYSGNMDFCDVENSLLIKNKIVQTKGFSDSVYSRIPNAYWAEPSLSSAVKKIRYIFSNTEECELLVENAFKYAQEHLTNEQLQLKMNKILEITQSRK